MDTSTACACLLSCFTAGFLSGVDSLAIPAQRFWAAKAFDLRDGPALRKAKSEPVRRKWVPTTSLVTARSAVPRFGCGKSSVNKQTLEMQSECTSVTRD